MALIDDILNPISATLEANISWLTTAYGKVQRLPKIENGRTVYYPALFTGSDNSNNAYDDLRPDSLKGNYSFWEVDDEQEFLVSNSVVRPKFKFKLIVWWHWPSIYPTDWRSRSIEEIKGEILQVLCVSQYTNVIEVFTVHENASKIYSSYDLDETKEQFLMREYGGLAIEGEIYGFAGCQMSMTRPTIPANLFGVFPFNYLDAEQVFPGYKWFGKTVYCRAHNLGIGSDEYVPLTGISDTYTILPFSVWSSISTVNGVPQTGGAILGKDAGLYELFLPLGTEENKYVSYYTKP